MLETSKTPSEFLVYINPEEIKMEGYVKWFDDRVGYGFILGEDGQDYFVHQSEIEMEGNGTLRQGQQVEFEFLSQAEGKAPLAKNVRRIEQDGA